MFRIFLLLYLVGSPFRVKLKLYFPIINGCLTNTYSAQVVKHHHFVIQTHKVRRNRV